MMMQIEQEETQGLESEVEQEAIQEGFIPEENSEEKDLNEALKTKVPYAFDFKLTLVLKAREGDKNPTTIPVSSGSVPNDRVEEIITKQISSDYFLKRLRAIVGEPLSEEDRQQDLERLSQSLKASEEEADEELEDETGENIDSNLDEVMKDQELY